MLISFIFGYSEKFFVVFYLSFYFVLGQGPSARDVRWGEGSELEALEWREEEVHMRRWRAWLRLGERDRRRQRLGMEDGYGRRGEAVVDVGRRWCAWRRPGERERR